MSAFKAASFKPCDKKILKAHIAKFPVSEANGILWYKWWFSKSPNDRVYFLGDETVEPSRLAESPRFRKQGRRFVQKMHTFVEVSDNHQEFRKHVADLVDRHKRRYHLEHITAYDKITTTWMEFLERTIGFSDEERAEWGLFFKNFSKEVARARLGIY